MRLGVVRKSDDPARAMWRALSHTQRLLAVALGLYAIDAEGRPVLDGEVMAVKLKEIEKKAAEGRL